MLQRHEVGLGDAVGMAGWPLDKLDPVAIRIGDPAGPRPVCAAGKQGRLGRDPHDGKIGEACVQRLDRDDGVVDAGAEVDRAPRRVVDQPDGDEVVRSGSWSMLRLPVAVSSTVPDHRVAGLERE